MKILRNIVAFTLLFYLTTQKTLAQLRSDFNENPIIYEAGISIGIMNCFTDVGGRGGLGKTFIKDLNIGNTQLSGSIYFSALHNFGIGVRLQGTVGRIKAYDSILKDVKVISQGRYERSLQFRSKINEIALVAEIHPRYIINWYRGEERLPLVSPYFTLGVGYFSFNPQAKLNNDWIDLQPLSTEGQGFIEYPNRKIYKLNQLNIPLGLGIRYEMSNVFNLRIEFMHRFLRTDYLDDLSTRYINPALFSKYFTGTRLSNALALNDRRSKSNPLYPVNATGGQIRGNPNDNDSYFTFNLKAGFTLGRKENASLRQLRCPTRF